MPTYDYRCTTCGHRFEKMQSMSAAALTHCPVEECIQEEEALKGTGEVRRMVTGGAGLVFKGEGFYLTDYVKKGKSKEGGSGESSGSSSGGGGE
jgi:putative FmdB family regulatory protein